MKLLISKAHPFAPKAASAVKASDLKPAKPATDPVSKAPSSKVTAAPAVPKSKEAQVKEPSSGLPKSAAAEPKVKGAPKQLTWGAEVSYVDKKRYPKRPNNALGETSATWVIPKGQKPVYSGQGKKDKEEGGEQKPGAEKQPGKLTVQKEPAVSTKDHNPVKPVDPKQTPKVAEQSLLDAKAAKYNKAKEDRDRLKARKESKDVLSEAKAGKTVTDPDGSKVHSNVSKDAAGNTKTSGHVHEDVNGKKTVLHSDQDLINHVENTRGSDKKAVPTADDHRESAKAAREMGATDIAAKHEKLASAKDKMAEKEPEKKLPKSKDEKDLETADKEAKKFGEKLKIRKDDNEKKEKAKLEKQKQSSDDKVVKEAQKELKGKAEERARKAKSPDSPEANAAHQVHVTKAKDASKKVDDLLKDANTSDSDKAQLQALKSSLDVSAKQKHEPNGDEKKRLNEAAKVVNHLHGNRQKNIKAADREHGKQVKLKVKEWDKQDKADVKEKSDAVKNAQKEQKESAKAADKQAKGNTQVVQDVEAHNSEPKSASKVGLGAFHSGRAAGEQASNNAAQDNGAGLGHQATSGAVSGAASIGHKLLGGKDEKETRYTVRNRKEQISQGSTQQTVHKALWHNEPEEEDTESATQMAKSLTSRFKQELIPSSDRELEFLTVECGHAVERVQKGLVSVAGKLEGRYAEWLCKKSLIAISDLRGSFKSE